MADTHILEVSLVDDGTIQLLLVLHNRLVGSLRDHRAGSAVLGVDIFKKVGDDLAERLARLLVQVGDGNSSC